MFSALVLTPKCKEFFRAHERGFRVKGGKRCMSSFNSFLKTVPTARSMQLRRELPGAKKKKKKRRSRDTRNRCGGR